MNDIKYIFAVTGIGLMVLCAIGFLMLASGCSTYVFKLNNKDIVFCKDIIFNECLGGVSLYRCDDGKARICQYNLEEVVDEKARKEILEMRRKQLEEEKKTIEMPTTFIFPYSETQAGI